MNFLKDYEEAKYLKDSGESLGEDDDRSVADLLVEAILKSLNTHAQILPISQGQVDVEEVLEPGFLILRELSNPGWLKEIRGEHIPETEEYGIGSFIYCKIALSPGKIL